MTLEVPDAERLMHGYVNLVAEAPFRLVPERNDELINDVFDGKMWDIYFIKPSDPRQQGFFARPLEQEFSATFSAMLSLWGVACAALLLSSEAAKAVRTGCYELTASPNSPTATAMRLIKASQAVLLEPRFAWPKDLPAPEIDPAEGTHGWSVNNLFLAATGWVLLHEIAHVHLKHEGTTINDIVHRQEEQADEWATKMTLGAATEPDKEFRVFCIATACVWLGVWDVVAPTAQSHPHPSRRLLAASSQFAASDLSPGLELSTYLVKALFEPSTTLPARETVEEAFDDVVMAYLRSQRWTP